MNRKIKIVGITALLFTLTAASCTDQSDASQSEQKTAEIQLDAFLKAQPVPIFNWSQLRQNLIEIETAQASTTATTSFMLNVGVADPVYQCESIGFPIPGTYQLTNPDQVIGRGDTGVISIHQLESTGVYTGDTTGTYVICVNAKGKAYPFYHEGYVSVIAGPAEWDYDKHQAVLSGSPSVVFTSGK